MTALQAGCRVLKAYTELMPPSASDADLVAVQICPDRLAAEVIAKALEVESVPAVVRVFGGIPGLDEGAEVLVPPELVHRARWIMDRPGPSDAELTFLATGKLSADPNSER